MDRERPRIVKDPLKESYDYLDEYQELLHIDKYELDNALVEQGTVFYRVGENYCEAISKRDFAKAQLEHVKATLDKEIRKESKTSSEKLTEAQVAARVLDSPTFAQAFDYYLDWKTVSEKWLTLKESFEQRAYALRELCHLWSANYYIDNIAKADKNEARDRVADRARALEKQRRNG